MGRRDECPHCGADVHVCRNCRFYDATAYNECREPVAERVIDKERANFCPEFKARTDDQPTKASPSRDDLLAQANKLFK